MTDDTATPTTAIGLLCFEGMDLLDLTGPHEVLLTANRLLARDALPPLFEIVTIGESRQAYGGLTITPSHRVEDIERLDVLLVPGAIDVDAARPDADIAVLAPRAATLASVCTGVFFLQRVGLLDERSVTTHWEDVDLLDHPSVRSDVRWIDHGDLVTSGGISSGIAMALHLVERFGDRALAERTARQLDYVWTESRTH